MENSQKKRLTDAREEIKRNLELFSDSGVQKPLFFIQRRSKDSEEPDAEPDEEEELALRAHLEIEAELNEMSDERSHDKARQQEDIDLRSFDHGAEQDSDYEEEVDDAVSISSLAQDYSEMFERQSVEEELPRLVQHSMEEEIGAPNWRRYNNEDESIENYVLGESEENRKARVRIENLPQNFNKDSPTPAECFTLFFNDEVCELIIEESNRYKQQYIEKLKAKEEEPPVAVSRWLGLTKILLIRYLCCKLIMGVAKKVCRRDYWTNNPFFSTSLTGIMARDTFDLIERFLHLADNKAERPPNAKMFKVQALHDRLNELFILYYQPGSVLCIDEYLGHFKGKAAHCKVYCPDKPYKWGVKEYMLVDSVSHYTLRSFYYSKQDKKQEDKKETKTLTHKLVMKLLDGIAREGDHLYTDNYYTSYSLFAELHSKNVKATGTVRIDRLSMDEDIRKAIQSSKTQRFTTDIYLSERSQLTLYYDKSKDPVKVLSNAHTEQYYEEIVYEKTTVVGKYKKIRISKPQLISDYNTYSHGVDTRNQMVLSLRPLLRIKKWWKVCFQSDFSASIVNSFIIWRELLKDKKTTFQKYIEKLLEGLISITNIEQLDNLIRNSQKKKFNHFIITKTEVEGEKKIQRICLECKKKTTFRCSECFKFGVKRGLCTDCITTHQKKMLIAQGFGDLLDD